MDSEFERELKEGLYIHRPLPLHRERGLESGFPHKKVLAERDLSAVPRAEGTALLEEFPDYLRMTAPLRSERWTEGSPADGDYCSFGTARLAFSFGREDWRGYNRLRFWVRPYIEGARILHLNAGIVSQGKTPVPDPYGREGATVFDLESGVWQECVWEFAAMPRDAVCRLSFYVFCSGHDVSAELRAGYPALRGGLLAPGKQDRHCRRSGRAFPADRRWNRRDGLYRTGPAR